MLDVARRYCLIFSLFCSSNVSTAATAAAIADDREWERMVMPIKTPNNTPTKDGDDDSDVIFVSTEPLDAIVGDKRKRRRRHQQGQIPIDSSDDDDDCISEMTTRENCCPVAVQVIDLYSSDGERLTRATKRPKFKRHNKVEIVDLRKFSS